MKSAHFWPKFSLESMHLDKEIQALAEKAGFWFSTALSYHLQKPKSQLETKNCD